MIEVPIPPVEILHKLITLRVYMDTEIPKAKQFVTNWIKEIKENLK